jgi:CheY-like chemotaxis protein
MDFMNLLFVDDIELNRVFYSAMLEHLGVKYTAVSSGKEAVDAYKEQDYDMIFMDCVMPEMSGYEAAALIRDYEKQKQKTPTQIIALTAKSSGDARDKAIEAGMDDFFQKPLTVEVMAKIKDDWERADTLNDDFGSEQVLLSEGSGLSEDCVLFDCDMALSLKGLLKDKYAQMIGHFKTDIQNFVGSAYEAVETGDLTKIHAAMHTIKSTSHQIGLLRVAHLASELEALCEAEHISENIAPRGAALREQLDHLHQAYILSEELLDKV